MAKKLKTFAVEMSYMGSTTVIVRAIDEDDAEQKAFDLLDVDPSLIEEMKENGCAAADHIEETDDVA